MAQHVDADNTIWVLDNGGVVHCYFASGAPISSVHSGASAIGPWGSNVTVWGIANASGGYEETFQNLGEAVRTGVALPYAFPNGSP